MHRMNEHSGNLIAGPGRTIAALSASALIVVCALLLLAAGSSASGRAEGASASSGSAPQPASARIGTYDSRAVAVAYARSAPFTQKMKDLRQQRSEAEKAGDKKRIAELDAQGESMQVRMNLQGFSNAPVDDVLETVRERLPDVAGQKNVTAIARVADYHDPAVDLVDITDDLVALFNPDGQTLKIVSDLRQQKPLAIEEAAKLRAK